MRGADDQSGSLFSYVSLEERIPARHPLRKVRSVVNDALATLDAEFSRLYSAEGRPSIAPERLLRAALIQILFSVRSERQLMDQMQYNLIRLPAGSLIMPLEARPKMDRVGGR
jgi:transposase